MHNIKELISSRLVGQYKNSVNFIKFLDALSSEFNTLHVETRKVIDERYFENAEGVNLDVLGEIVGIKREVASFVKTNYFGFLQDTTSKGYDSLNATVEAGRYRSASEGALDTRTLVDSEYKTYMNAKILKNSSSITPNQVMEITKIIIDEMYPSENIGVSITELGNAVFDIVIKYLINEDEKAFISSLDLIPRPSGVRVNYIYQAP